MTTLEKIREGIDTRFKEARLENTRFYYDVLDIIDKYAEEPMKESLNGVFLELSELGIQDIVCAEEIYRLIHITYEIGFNTGFNEAKAEQEPCDDVVSRQAVLDLIEHYNSDGLGSVFYGYEQGVKFADAVNKLPSVRPQEQTGHWETSVDRWGEVVATVNGYRCSECGEFNGYNDKYCPNCGCRMVEPQESEVRNEQL